MNIQASNGFSTFTFNPYTSATLRVTWVRPLTLAVAAGSASTNGAGRIAFMLSHCWSRIDRQNAIPEARHKGPASKEASRSNCKTADRSRPSSASASGSPGARATVRRPRTMPGSRCPYVASVRQTLARIGGDLREIGHSVRLVDPVPPPARTRSLH